MLYFAYNDNMKTGTMRARAGSARLVGKAALNGHELTFDSVGYADIVGKPGGKVFGALYRVSAKEARLLDRFEGAPVIGRRKKVEVECNGKAFKAFAYERAEKTEFKRPLENYLQQICEGLAESGWGKEEVERAKRRAGYLF